MRASAKDPISQLASWIEGARSSGAAEPDSMVIATATKEGVPSARVVLCRGIDARGLVFYTNYESRKGRELAENPRAAAVFLFASVGRQARVEGRVEKLTAAESDHYFAQRPRGHQLGAWASPQSQTIDSLSELVDRKAALEIEYKDRKVPRPTNWGGYRLAAERIELWESGDDRLHHRHLYHREGHTWRLELLAP